MTDSGYDKPNFDYNDVPAEVLNNICTSKNENENLDTETSKKESQKPKKETVDIYVKENNYTNPLLDNKSKKKNNDNSCRSRECLSERCEDTFSEENLYCYGLNILFWGWLSLVILHQMGIISLPRSSKVFTDWDFSNVSDSDGAIILIIIYIIVFIISVIIMVCAELFIVVFYGTYIYYSMKVYGKQFFRNYYSAGLYLLILGEFYRCSYRCCQVYDNEYQLASFFIFRYGLKSQCVM